MKIQQLTKAEEQVMQYLWQINGGFVNDILEIMPEPKPHYNTVSTILKILVDKNFVAIKQLGKSNLYQPIIHKDDYGKKNIQNILKGYYDDSFSKMLSFFAKEKKISIAELESILKDLKKDQL